MPLIVSAIYQVGNSSYGLVISYTFLPSLLKVCAKLILRRTLCSLDALMVIRELIIHLQDLSKLTDCPWLVADTRSGTKKLVQPKERTENKVRTQLDRRCQRQGREEALRCFLKDPRTGFCQAAKGMGLNSSKGDHWWQAFTSHLSVLIKAVFFISQICSITENQERRGRDPQGKANSSKSRPLLQRLFLPPRLLLLCFLLLLLFFLTPLR